MLPPPISPRQKTANKQSLTHGFFGELSDEIISKQVREYTHETMTYLFEAGCTEFKNLMSIMETNDGRNKIFGLVQYSIMLYVKCMTS